MKVPKEKTANGFVIIENENQINSQLKELSNFFEVIPKKEQEIDSDDQIEVNSNYTVSEDEDSEIDEIKNPTPDF